MTIKKYFENNSFSNNSLTDLESKEGIDFESFEYLDELEEQRTRFIPSVDFSKPENFARYGLAEQYYKDAIARIINNYPYDGSKKELVEWYNDSTYFDLYVFENEYPRSNGYGIFAASGWGTQSSTADGYGLSDSLEYIFIKGGPNAGPNNTYDGGNIYDPTEQRNSNLALNLGTRGATVEFWLKKDEFIPSLTEREVIFDLWNNELSSSDSYGRFRLELNTSSAGNFASSKAFRAIIHSGSTREEVLLGDYTTTASFTSQGWTHFAFAASSTAIKLYKNGELDSSVGFGSVFNNISGTLNAYVGALITAPSGSSASAGAGGLSGSIDEFRYWKITRSERDIERNWFTNVYGGTNTDDANTDLGVYFKFNEGITGNSTTDAVVLDYSGRISNGAWTGYTSASRNTGSAIVLASAAEKEFKDPILRTNNALYTTYYDSSLEKGKRHDINNSSNIFYSFPDWIVDEDLNNGEKLLELAQVISSYFDTAQLQIGSLRELKDIEYNSQTIDLDDKPTPFAERLLTERGMIAPDFFVERSVLENLSQKSSDKNLESDLFDLKNLIYQNIYNNISELTKQKGTKDSIRNILHTMGIGEELVASKIYLDSEKLILQDEKSYNNQSIKFIDFSKRNFRDANVYQTGSTSNELGYISSSTDKTAFCMESFIRFPKIDNNTDVDLIPNFLVSSLFGLHDIDETSAPYNTWESPSAANFFIRAVKNNYLAEQTYFELSSSVSGITSLSSSVFNDIYNNSDWYFSVQLEPQNILFPSSSLPDYNLIFSGYSYLGNILANSFVVSSSIDRATALSFLQTNQKVYIGAERTNFTGGLLYSTDVRNAGLRFWLRNLTADEQKSHAQDFLNYGSLTKFNNSYSLTSSLRQSDLSATDYLALSWQFDKISSTDASGMIEVLDSTSGSSERRSRGSYVDAVAGYHYPATSYEFPVSSTNVVQTLFIDSYSPVEFDGYNSDNLVEIKTKENEQYGLNSRFVSFISTVEKSVQAGINEEMLKMFGSVKELAANFSQPIDRYRKEYKNLRFLRERFFKNVANDVDFEDFLEFYKWVDSAVQALVGQFIPAAANYNEDVFNVIESHVLERNKYQTKFPTLELRQPDPESGAESINKLNINWKFNHAPIPLNQNENCEWWYTRIERSDPALTSGDTATDASRQAIQDVLNATRTRSYTTPQKFKVDDLYVGKDTREATYWDAAIQEFGRITDVDGPGPLTQSVSVDYLLIQATGIEPGEDCRDIIIPNKKVKRVFKVENSREYDAGYSYPSGQGRQLAPFTLWSSSVDTGYQVDFATIFTSSTNINNHHDDIYSRFRNAPLQSPFTEGWVGGRQYRHITLNVGSDAQGTRPEGFYLLAGADFAGTASLGVVKTTYTSDGTHDFDTPRAALYREELAKRPLNIKNRQYSTASSRLGNFKETYEVVMTNGRTKNNLWFHDNSSQVLTETEVWNLNRGTTSPYLDATLPTRGVVKSVIVNRFSAPGGPEIQSRGYLEPTGEELSPYNAYPFRNTGVIFSSGSGNNDFTGSTGPRVNINTNIHTQNDGLRVLLSRRRGKYGVDSVFGSINSLDYNTTGSYQKVYENTYNYTNASTTRVYNGTISTGGFKVATNPAGGDTVTIPYTSTLSVVFTFVVGASVVPTEITIGASASDTATNAATKITNHPTLLSYLSATAVGTNVSISFNSVGANNYTISTSVPAKLTIVNFSGGTDPIDETYPSRTYYDNFFVVHQVPRTPANYSWVNYALTGTSGSFSYSRNATVPSASTSQAIPFAELITLNEQNPGLNRSYTGLYTGSSIIAAQVTASLYSSMVDQGSTEITNTLTAPNVRLENFHTYVYAINNSLFGHNSFSQIRGGESRQARSLRENNTLSFRYLDTRRRVDETQIEIELVENISMSPIIEHYPIQQELLIGSNTVDFEYSFANELEFLPLRNRKLNAITNLREIRRKKKTSFNYVSDAYTLGSAEFRNLIYKQNIWPKTERTFLKENRQRTQFAINWWSSGRSTRDRNDFVNSMNEIVLTSSIWGLDGINTTTYEVKDTFTQYTASWLDGTGISRQWTGIYENNKKNLLGVGELQNDYSIIIKSGGTFIGPWLGSAYYAQSTTLSPYDAKIHPFPLMESRVQLGSLYARPFSINNVNNLIYKISGSATYDAFVPHQTVGGTVWSAPEEAGKEPFYYKDYDAYVQEVRSAGKEYSVIPEFRISETIDQILTGEEGEATVLSPMLSITGGFIQDDTNRSFYADYTNSDFLRFFNVVKQKHNSAEIEDKGTLTLSCKAIKKFLPYEGFYPAQRIMQLGTLFSQSYYDSGIFSGSAHPSYDSSGSQGNRAGFTPFLAPGVLCNSIKSGISVSFPVFTSSLSFDDRITGSYTSLGGLSRYDNSIARISASYGSRLTIENLLDPISSADTFYDGEVDETMILFAGNTSVDKTRTGNRLFSYAINNFTAETMNLFLKNRTVSSLISAGENDFIFDPAKEYRMKVRIFEEDMDMYNGQRSFGPPTDDSQQLNGSRASYLPFLPPYDIGANDQEEGVTLIFKPTNETHSIEYILNNLTESFTIYDDLNISEGVSIAIDNRSKITDSIDFKRKVKVGDSSRALPSAPEYAISIQPKWECPVLDFSHRTGSLPSITNTYATMSLEVVGGINTTTDKITISDGFQEIEFFVRTSNDFANGQIDGSVSASDLITNLRDCITSSSPEYISGSTINHNFDITTPTSTSITFTAKAPGRKVNPVITSNNLTAYTTEVLASGSGFCDNSSPSENYYIGMWHQYGRIPTGSQGIKMQITEPLTTDTTGSLAQVLGFTNQSVRIGEIADSRRIKEAIVAIPYTVVAGQKRLFDIDLGNTLLARNFVEGRIDSVEVPRDYVDLIEKGKQYVFPPQYDFFYRPLLEVNPFAMFIFEFDMKLNKQDLADIWQNLPPTSTNGKKDLTSGFDKEESRTTILYGEPDSWFPEGLPAGTRWMVFKVKQRASYDYYEQVRNSSLAKGLRERVNVQGSFVNPVYSYNWPYDFCSFVELAKIDASIENSAITQTSSGRREELTRTATPTSTTSGTDREAASARTGGRVDPGSLFDRRG